MTKSSKVVSFPSSPKGTRDLYPEDVLRRRYIQNAWRDASLRCGFDEIEGPTFESTDLYSIKSGDGILNELFQVFSGKGGVETLEKLVERGQADFALRPEFTPTLARMFAARGRQLPRPCKWFTAGAYFRAERPQRGRLREFLQWNCDIVGLPGEEDSAESRARMDAETIEPCVLLLEMLGLTAENLQIRVNDRFEFERFLVSIGVGESQLEGVFGLVDKIGKMSGAKIKEEAGRIGLSESVYGVLFERSGDGESYLGSLEGRALGMEGSPGGFEVLGEALGRQGLGGWCVCDPYIVRGLAYYTGTVFEAIVDGERAVAGGGRYDRLIELMGGAATPAAGFAMGDVVLGNLLEDKGLMPSGVELMEAVGRGGASVRPEVFIAVPNDDAENEVLSRGLAGVLRRGVESEGWLSRDGRRAWDVDRYSVGPVHARVSYKSTTNPGKLRADAQKQHARFFVEIHGHDKVELTDMDAREAITSDSHGSFSVDPGAENYVGRVLLGLL